MSYADDDDLYLPPRIVTCVCPRGHEHPMVVYVAADRELGTLELAVCPDTVPYADMPKDAEGFSSLPAKEAGKA